VAKHDAFGREIGEDTLAGLGGGSEVKPAPEPAEATWQERTERDEATWDAAEKVEVARLETAADAKEEQAERAEDLRQEAAGGSRWTPPPSPAGRRPPTITLPVPPARSRRRGRKLVWFIVLGVILVVVLPLMLAGFAIVNTVGDATRELDDAFKIERPDAPAAAPTGLGRGSLVREAQFAAAMRRLQGERYGGLTSLRVAPERINAQFLTDDGRLVSVQLSSDGKLQTFGGGGTGFSTDTIPYSRVRAAVPERLTRRAAKRVGKPATRLDYLVLSGGGPRDLLWGAFFKGGGHVQGFADGRVWRRVS
jgi:hypothetical protein